MDETLNFKYYDSIASGYDELHKKEQVPKITRAIQILQNYSCSEQDTLLDVGCGTGFALDILHDQLSCECSGIEPSQGMIRKYHGKHTLLLAPAEHIPFPDNHFSIITSFTAIQNFDDVLQGVLEMKRVCQEGGTLIITCLKRSPKLEFITQTIADFFRIEALEELEKDVLFVCRCI